MRMYALVDKETGVVLKLMGLDVMVARDVKEDFKKIVEKDDNIILITTYEILNQLKKEIKESKKNLLIMPIPDRRKGKKVDIFKDVIKRTVGIEIKIGR